VRVLVLGGTSARVAELIQGDSRISEIVRGAHHRGSTDLRVGEPDFDLVIHDCADEDSMAYGLPLVGDRFLQEVTQNDGVHIGFVGEKAYAGSGHLASTIATAQSGDATPIIVPTDHVRGMHIEPFLDSHASEFGRQVLVQPGRPYRLRGAGPLAHNQYGDTVIGSTSADWTEIALPRPGGAAAHENAARIIAAFALEAIPALHPRLLAGLADSPRAAAVRGEIEEEIARHRLTLTELRDQLNREEGFLAEHAALANTLNEVFKIHVRTALQDVFELDVVDLDAVMPEEKLADLYVRQSQTVVEVRGSRRRNARQEDVDSLARNADRLATLGWDVERRVLLFNGQLGVNVADRADPFGRSVVSEALVERVCLMSGADFLERVVACNADSYDLARLSDEWAEPGVAGKL
jgi:hypothetical protein